MTRPGSVLLLSLAVCLPPASPDVAYPMWSGPIQNVSNTPGYNDLLPQVTSAGQVVWLGRDGADYDIFFWDGNQVWQLTKNDYEDGYAQISGAWVTWHGRGADGTAEVYRAYVPEPGSLTQGAVRQTVEVPLASPLVLE